MEQDNNIEELALRAEQYAQTSIELAKLKILDRTGDVVSTFTAKGVSAVVLLMGTFLISMGAALYIGKLLGESFFGFLIVGGAYILVGVILMFSLEGAIKKSILKSLLPELLK